MNDDDASKLEQLIYSALTAPKLPPLDLRTAPKEHIIYKIQTFPAKFSFCDCCEKIVPAGVEFCPICNSYNMGDVPIEIYSLLTNNSSYIDYSIFIE